jgi:hypothetical protein
MRKFRITSLTQRTGAASGWRIVKPSEMNGCRRE